MDASSFGVSSKPSKTAAIFNAVMIWISFFFGTAGLVMGIIAMVKLQKHDDGVTCHAFVHCKATVCTSDDSYCTACFDEYGLDSNGDCQKCDVKTYCKDGHERCDADSEGVITTTCERCGALADFTKSDKTECGKCRVNNGSFVQIDSVPGCIDYKCDQDGTNTICVECDVNKTLNADGTECVE